MRRPIVFAALLFGFALTSSPARGVLIDTTSLLVLGPGSNTVTQLNFSGAVIGSLSLPINIDPVRDTILAFPGGFLVNGFGDFGGALGDRTWEFDLSGNLKSITGYPTSAFTLGLTGQLLGLSGSYPPGGGVSVQRYAFGDGLLEQIPTQIQADYQLDYVRFSEATGRVYVSGKHSGQDGIWGIDETGAVQQPFAGLYRSFELEDGLLYLLSYDYPGWAERLDIFDEAGSLVQQFPVSVSYDNRYDLVKPGPLDDLWISGRYDNQTGIWHFDSDGNMIPGGSTSYGRFDVLYEVPEPSTALLVAAGLAGLAAAGRRRPL